MSGNNPGFAYPRGTTELVITTALAVPQAGFTAALSLPIGTVFALATFSAAPGNLTVQHQGNAGRLEFRTGAVDYKWPSDSGLRGPILVAHTLEFQSTIACNITLWAYTVPASI